jgi:hypothetical protein
VIPAGFLIGTAQLAATLRRAELERDAAASAAMRSQGDVIDVIDVEVRDVQDAPALSVPGVEAP